MKNALKMFALLCLVAVPASGDLTRPRILCNGVFQGFPESLNFQGATCTGTGGINAITVVPGTGPAGPAGPTGPTGPAGPSSTPGGSSGDLQINNGLGGFSGYISPSGCTNQFMRSINNSGAISCSNVKDTDVASPYSGTGFCAAHKWASTLNRNAVPTCTQPDYSDLTGTPTIPTNLSAEPFITKVASANLSNDFALGSLANGLLLNTTTTGVPTIYAGTSCAANQYMNALDASGVKTCAQVTTAQLSGTVTNAQLASTYSGTGACAASKWASTLNGNAAPTCTQPAYSDLTGTPTIPADISSAHYVTTQAEAGLSAEAVLPTCTGTDKLTFDGTTITCATDQTGSASPGAPTSSVQYNNAGAFGGTTNITSDGTDETWAYRTAAPSAPAAGTKPYFKKPLNITMPGFLFNQDSATGSAAPDEWFTGVGTGRQIRACVLPNGFGSTTFTSILTGAPITAGTASSSSWSNANIAGRYPSIKALSTLATNSSGGFRGSGPGLWLGNAAGQGGFFFWASFSIGTINASDRVFAGLNSSISVLSGDPSALVHTIYFGVDSAGDSNLDICSDDGSAPATCVDLGANYPARSSNTGAYNIYFWAAPNASSVGWAIERLDVANSTSGTISSKLPGSTTPLTWQITANTGATLTTQVSVNFFGACMLINP